MDEMEKAEKKQKDFFIGVDPAGGGFSRTAVVVFPFQTVNPMEIALKEETRANADKLEEHNYPGKYSAVIEEADDDPREMALKKTTRTNADKPPAVTENAPTERKPHHVSFTTRLD